jgi:Iron-sulfur cluster-binding domain
MNVIAVLSMLHEKADKPGSATRRFRGEAPLAWTLFRLGRCKRLAESIILCWEDQATPVRAIAEEMKARFWSPKQRITNAHLDGVAAARRWADGWRGGLLGACEFDRGFHGPSIAEIRNQTDCDAVLLVDPSSSLVDCDLIDGLIEHAESHPDLDLCFSQAAPGLSGVLLHKRLVEQLAPGGSHPGTLLSYRPDLPMRDAISTPSCAPVATRIARSSHRFTLDSERQIERISSATVHLNGQLMSTEAEHLVGFLDAAPARFSLPREITIELTPRRASKPIYSPLHSTKIERGDLSADMADTIFNEMSAADDARIVFAGVGDPLLHPDFSRIVESSQRAGIGAVSIETDLLEIAGGDIDTLAELPIDIITVHLPAVSAQTYAAVMGIDGLGRVMANLTRLIHRRQASGRGTPLVTPTFIKTPANFAEMDAWYDHWLRVLGCAVVGGPTDFAGQITDVSLTQMQPPRRHPCVRIHQRVTILSDARFALCEQDFLGRESLGKVGEHSINNIWTGPMASLSREHSAGNFNCNGLCADCRDWHRP